MQGHATMRVMVVASPHAVATRDVYMGHLHGVEKVGQVPRSFAANILAAEPVFGAAHYHEVDVVYLISPMYFPIPIVQMLRKDGFQVWAYFTECPYEDEFWSRVQAPQMDVCFVSDRMSVDRYRVFNERTYYLPHAYDPDVHFPAASVANGHKHVSFVGTGFPRRRTFLEEEIGRAH